MDDVKMAIVLKVENLCKNFKEHMVLENINFEIQEGEMVAITGKSGRGKSTILNIIGLIIEKSSGSISIFGEENVGIHSKKAMLLRRNRIGYLFQNFGLVDEETVEWNLKLALKYKKLKKEDEKKRIEQVLQKFHMDSYMKTPVYKLSGGEQQRVAMARILLQESQLILADEPTGSLDKGNRDLVIHTLQEMQKEGKTILIVTHDLDVAKQCDRMMEL